MSIYQAIILDHFKNPRNWGTLPHPTTSVTVDNPLCGDKIRMDIELKNDKVSSIKFSGDGCAISKASASLLSEYMKGKERKSLINLDKEFMIKLIGIEVGVNRLKCLLLPLEALHKALHVNG